MSGGEPSSIKRKPLCAARVPALSLMSVRRVYHNFQRPVCGLAARRDLHPKVAAHRLYLHINAYHEEANENVSGALQKVASAHL